MVAHSESLRDAALFYAARGWWVFPCKPRGKAPATEHGFLDATLDPDQVRRWWADNPNYNIGLACGRSCLAVIDVDPRNGGAESLAALEQEHAPLPNTVASLTGGGGQHYLFRAPQGVKLPSKLAPGIDLKAGGGYIIAPPSIHPNGKLYRWGAGAHPNDIELAPVPEWVLKLLEAEPLQGPSPKPAYVSEGLAPAWLLIVFEAVVDRLTTTGHQFWPSGSGGIIAQCPFHDDENPSLSIHPFRGWKCFAGCGEGRLTKLAAMLGISIVEGLW